MNLSLSRDNWISKNIDHFKSAFSLFYPSSSIKKDATFLQTVIAALYTRQKNICECCGRIGFKADACIICGPKLPTTSLRINMNQFNALHGEEPNKSPR